MPGTTRDGRKRASETASAAQDGDPYEILGELATGGMATVYLARLRRALGFSRLVAIKCMHPQYAKDPSFAAMFVDEARLTARLRHPNIVPTVDIVADDGKLLLVMDYVEGESLAGLARLVGQMGEQIPVPLACAIVHDVLLGLHAAHEARDDDGTPLGIVHRDVSPQNVIVGIDGMARVLDFGVAKARRSGHHSEVGEIKGKIPYMAPEQLFGEELDRTVDVYAAGVLLWETLVGARLFEGGSETALVRRITSGAIAKPSERRDGVSAELDALVLRASSREAADRFPTALAMAEQLSAITSLPTRSEISAWTKRFARARQQFPAAIERRLGTPTRLFAARRPARKLRVLALGAGVLLLASAALAIPTRGETVAPSIAAAPNATVASPRSEASAKTEAPIVVPLAGPLAVAPEPAPARATPPSAAKVDRPKDAASASNTTGDTRLLAPGDDRAAAAKTDTGAPAAAANAANVANAVSCKLPYTVDADGHRHYKSECL